MTVTANEKAALRGGGNSDTLARARHAEGSEQSQTLSIRAAVERYLALGWQVVPLHDVTGGACSCGRDCPNGGKHPLYANWSKTRLTPAAIEQTYQQRPGSNVGIATGAPSGFWALDIDPDNGGDVALKELERDNGPLPATRTHRTGSGGHHFLFSMPDDFEPTNSSGRLPDGIDVRGTGGQIVVAPSVSSKGAYEVVNDAPIVSAPAWLLDLIRPAPRAAPRAGQRVASGELAQDRLTRYAASVVELKCRDIRDAHHGRNTLAWGKGADLIRLVNAPWSGLDLEHVYQQWEDAVYAHPDGVIVPPSEAGGLWRNAMRRVGSEEAELPAERFAETLIAPEGFSLMGSPFLDPAPIGHHAAQLAPVMVQPVEDAPTLTRVVDLAPYLDGTYVAPEAARGGFRRDGKQLLYPGRWHTAVALNAAGKSWWALWHALEEMRRGSVVAYAHFEEPAPGGTIERLRSMGCEDEWLRERFVWFDTSRRWKDKEDEFANTFLALPECPALLVLDGINAACSQHGWPVDKTEAVGSYRSCFVTPATRRGTAVLSLGHPPKARDRQNERHGFGSTAWLDEVDGVGFRLEASRSQPIRRGSVGYTQVYTVKDRYGRVEAGGIQTEKPDTVWYDVGAFTLDSTEGATRADMLQPKEPEERSAADKLTILCDLIVNYLKQHGGAFDSQTALEDGLRASSYKYNKTDVRPALMRLEEQGLLQRTEAVRRGGAQGGILAPPSLPESDLETTL